MPVLPVYTSQENAKALQNSPQAGASDFGGGRGLMAFGTAVENAGDTLQTQVKLKQERDATAYVAEQASKLQLDSLKQIEAMKTDGQPIDTFTDRYNAWHDEAVKPLIDNAPNGLAKQAMEEHALSIKTSFGEKAIDFQANQTVAAQKQSSLNASDNISNLVYADPANANEYKRQLAVLQDSSKRYMTPEESAVFTTKSNSTFATSKIRPLVDTNPWAAEKLLKTDEYTSHLTNEAFISLTNRIESQKEVIQNREIALKNKDMKDFENDPAALAVRNGADVNDPQDIIDKSYLKQSDGSSIMVAPNNLSVMPKQQAAFIANQMNGINNADEMVATLDQVKKQYGDKYFPMAMRDLKNNGLSADAAFISHMDPVVDKNIIDASFAIDQAGAKKGEGVKVITDMARTRAATQGDKFADIDIGVSNNIRDSTEAMLSEGIPANEINNIQTRASNIASYFYSKGGNVSAATKQATDWINEKYKIGDVNGKNFRAPSDFDVNQIEHGLAATLNNLKPSDITTASPAAGAFAVDNLKRRGYFTLNGDQSGYILRDELGIPVRSGDGSSVFQVKIPDVIRKSEDVNQKSKADLIKLQVGSH